ncbi:MAG: alpha/beta fold hydrolase [Aggregatilineales bacterium]
MKDQPRQFRVTANGVALAVFEWLGTEPPLLFVHANSFHARCWDQVIAHLPGQHCYAIDQRGHGRSDKPDPPYAWRSFGEDVSALAQHIGLTGAIGIGHSLGGHAVTLAAALNPALFSALLLLDPVIFSQSLYTGRLKGEHFAARRRAVWESPDAMFERFKDRLPFSRWQPAVLRDYCNYGLLPTVQGNGYMLACPPTIEADIYAGGTALESNIYPEISTIQIPVRVLRAGAVQARPAEDLSSSPTAPDLATYFQRGIDTHLSDYSHLFPMENPALVARYIQELSADIKAAQLPG